MPELDLTKAIEAGAEALSQKWQHFPLNECDPDTRQMYLNTSAAMLTAAEAHLRAMIAQEIEDQMPPRNTFTDYQEGIQDGMNRAIRIAGRTNQ